MTTLDAGQGVLLQQELRRAGLPPYLMRAVLEVLPDAITDSTVNLLLSNLRSRGENRDPEIGGDQRTSPSRDSFHANPPADSTVIQSTGPAPELVDGWVADGGDRADLERVLTLVDYRIGALPLERAGGRGGVSAGPRSDLAAFWLSSGHDLQELRIFQKHVRAEAFGAVPK
ncbi:hypothetical protein [Parafrankia sp. FMc2]|uniref:hypothetical protein n=1 Tax=Parafrankia sp. FMc2 TaxID=3233196 RepID=UPI0034D67F76